ncbi:ATP synthase F0 [Metarhizium brunneum]
MASWMFALIATKSRMWEIGHLPASIFVMDAAILQAYWILLFIIQGAYICHTSLTMAQLATVPPMVDTHFIINNLLHTIFAILVFCADFVFAEAALVVNFFNLLTLYSIDSGGPRFHHAGLVAGPLSWTIVAIYWNGSMTLPQPGSLVAGILSSIFLFTVRQQSHNVQDYIVSFCLCLISSAIAAGQYHQMDANSIGQHSEVMLLVQSCFAFLIVVALLALTVAMMLAEWVSNRSRAEESHSPHTEVSK